MIIDLILKQESDDLLGIAHNNSLCYKTHSAGWTEKQLWASHKNTTVFHASKL